MYIVSVMKRGKKTEADLELPEPAQPAKKNAAKVANVNKAFFIKISFVSNYN
jgi:hypothetical protein